MTYGKVICAGAVVAAVFTGCTRFEKPVSHYYDVQQVEKSGMTLQEANSIVARTLVTTPTGRRPKNPGAQYIGSNVSAVKIRRHKHTNRYLVEVMAGERPFLKFYVANKATAEKFAQAVWRMKKEYGK